MFLFKKKKKVSDRGKDKTQMSSKITPPGSSLDRKKGATHIRVSNLVSALVNMPAIPG